MEIKNKVIIVTGASAGIGRATAKLLAKNGAKVALVARSKDKLQALSKSLPDSFPVVTDMSDMASVDTMIEKVKKHYGTIDVLVNNAGQGIYGAIEYVNIDDYRKIIDLNILGPLEAMQKVIPFMRAQKNGMIINISSMVSKNYYPYLGAYASTKYALNALSLTARAELEKDNIIVSVVHPGLTDTEFGTNSIKSDAVAKTMSSRSREGMPAPDSAEYVAERVLLAIENGRAEIYAHDEMEP
jgi:short-subunit dehydrogenase